MTVRPPSFQVSCQYGPWRPSGWAQRQFGLPQLVRRSGECLADEADLGDRAWRPRSRPATLEAPLDLGLERRGLASSSSILDAMGRRPPPAEERSVTSSAISRERDGDGPGSPSSSGSRWQEPPDRRLSLQAHLRDRGDGDVGDAWSSRGRTAAALAYKKWHTRRIVSVVGELTITRVGYAAPGHPSVHPLDAELQLPAGPSATKSSDTSPGRGVRPLRRGRHMVAELTGVTVPSAARADRGGHGHRRGRFLRGPLRRRQARSGDILVGASTARAYPW